MSTSKEKKYKWPLNICMISDFFYPSFGGVEEHLFNLSKCLIEKGHKVIVVTRQYGKRTGIRYIGTGLKVYYLPTYFSNLSFSLPTIAGRIPLMRYILVREQVDLVHAHASCSTLTHETIILASLMQIPRCYTDHSLLGFDTIGGIFINKISKFALADVCHVICVSNTSRENTVLRTLLNPINVSTIPNATIFENFTPCLEGRPNNGMIYIVVVSRLVERKGISILKNVIPRIAKYYPNIKFLIVGDGPKRVDLEQVCEKYQLQDRVFLYGALDNNKIRSILIKGHIFLNTSLTEAFCISIVEAASCGLLVVSTDVGGISEVLPSDLVVLAEPSVKSIYEAVTIAIKKVVTRDFIPTNVAERLKVYSWNSVSTRTEKVYIKCMEMQKSTFADRVHRYFGCGGAISGTIAVAIITMCTAFLSILEWFQPAETIEKPLCWSKYAVISKPDTYDIQNDICA